MVISPIINYNHRDNTSFGTKLPRINCTYRQSPDFIPDYWSTFAKNCIKNGKQDKLKELLGKLADHFDNNILALTYNKNKMYKDENYTFKLYKNSEDILNDTPQGLLRLNGEVNVYKLQESFFIKSESKSIKTIEGKQVHIPEISVYQEYSKTKTLTDILLDALEKILNPKTKEHLVIFNTNNYYGEESFLKDFRDIK